MIKGFKFMVGGKDYNGDIKGGFNARMQKAVHDRLNNQLGSLIDEINSEGGNLEFDSDTGKLSLLGCSPELSVKVQERLNKNPS